MYSYVPRLPTASHERRTRPSRWANAAPKVPLSFSLSFPFWTLSHVARRTTYFRTEFPREWPLFPASNPEIPIYLTLETIDDQDIKFVSIDCEFVLLRTSENGISVHGTSSFGRFIYLFRVTQAFVQHWNECTKDCKIYLCIKQRWTLVFCEKSLKSLLQMRKIPVRNKTNWIYFSYIKRVSSEIVNFKTHVALLRIAEMARDFDRKSRGRKETRKKKYRYSSRSARDNEISR